MRALLRNGVRPVLAGRNADRLNTVAQQVHVEFPDQDVLDTVVADATNRRSVAGLLSGPEDVLITTVGPFLDLGEAPVAAATDAGAGYLDSTGEPPFIKRVFEAYGPRAEGTGARLLPAFGYDYVPGALAATIAIRRSMAGARPPARVDVGYFSKGRVASSAGTRASMAGVLLADSFARHGGYLRNERPGARVRSFDTGDGRSYEGLSVGGIEHLTLHRLAPSLRDVNVYLGAAGRLTRAASVAGVATAGAARVPLLGGAVSSLARSAAGPGSRGGPDEATRAQARTLCIAETFDSDGQLQDRVRVEGPSPYDLTALLLAWGAHMVLSGATRGTGALGPADAFGTEAFVSGCMALGLAEVH